MDLDANAKPKSRRGFAAMNPERRREIARKGGASVPGVRVESLRGAAAAPAASVWRARLSEAPLRSLERGFPSSVPASNPPDRRVSRNLPR